MCGAKSARRGFTLVELMIVVAIIALLAVMAFPSFATARTKSQQSTCINNLRQISSGKDRYALDKMGASPATLADIVPDYLNRTPVCPNLGTYRVRRLGRDPACSKGSTDGHTI